MKLKYLWHEYYAVKTQNKCVYNAAIDSASEKETMYLMQFLMALNN